jgi:hypothetical protein
MAEFGWKEMEENVLNGKEEEGRNDDNITSQQIIPFYCSFSRFIIQSEKNAQFNLQHLTRSHKSNDKSCYNFKIPAWLNAK